MRRIVGLSAFFLTIVLMLSLNEANAVCCFPYNMNHYIDPTTGDFVLNGELNNDSYRGEPFGNTDYRFEFLDKNNNALLEKNILLTDILPITGGVVIPPLATFPFQVVLDDMDIKTVQQASNLVFDGTNTLDYFAWKPADLVVSSNEMTSIGMVHGKNDDVFVKWRISGNITNTHSVKTENVYVVASLRDKDDGILGVAGYSDDSIQPITLDGFETKDYVLYGLVPASKTPSSVNLYAESDDSSMVFPHYRPIILRDAMNIEEKRTTDPQKPITISANITNISRENLDFNWLIQIKKSPKSVSESDITEYPESRVVFVEKIPSHVDAQTSTILEYKWFPQSNGIYFYEMYAWDDDTGMALSFPFRNSFLDDNFVIVESNINSVKKQVKSGIQLDEVQCQKGLELAHKASNGNLVCIKPETKRKLIERGWAKLDSEGTHLTPIIPDLGKIGTYELQKGNKTYDIPYHIKGGSDVEEIFLDEDSKAINIVLKQYDSGSLEITLPRELIDAKISEDVDDLFFVLIDGEEVPYDETKNETSRTLTIQFEKESKVIEIIGVMPI